MIVKEVNIQKIKTIQTPCTIHEDCTHKLNAGGIVLLYKTCFYDGNVIIFIFIIPKFVTFNNI